MKPSIALPHNRLPNAPTPEFSRHILAPHPVPLHTQISQTSLLPFKHIRLLCAPLAAHPDDCRLRSALPSQFPATISRSRPSALSVMNLCRLPSAYAPHAHHQTNGHVSFLRPATVHDPHSLSCASPDLRRLAFRHPRRTLHPPSRAALGSDHHCPLHPPRAASAQLFAVLLTSAPPPPLAYDLPQSRSFPVTFLLPARSRCIHRPAKRAFSPSSTSACSVLPFAALSGNRQPPTAPFSQPSIALAA